MTMEMVDLGRIGSPPLREDDRRGQALHLTTRGDMLVVVGDPAEAGWTAQRVLWGGPGDNDSQVVLTGDDLARAATTMELDREAHPERYTGLWLLRVWQQFGERCADVARGMVVRTMMPGTHTLLLSPDNLRRLYDAGHVTHFGLTRHLTRLVTNSYLVTVPPGESPQQHLLNIPPSPPTESDL